MYVNCLFSKNEFAGDSFACEPHEALPMSDHEIQFHEILYKKNVNFDRRMIRFAAAKK